MSNKLFAFQVAKPVEPSEETFSVLYDPQTQTSIWQGGIRPLALLCTTVPNHYGALHCNAYGTYCNTWGGLGNQKCDS